MLFSIKNDKYLLISKHWFMCVLKIKRYSDFELLLITVCKNDNAAV